MSDSFDRMNDQRTIADANMVLHPSKQQTCTQYWILKDTPGVLGNLQQNARVVDRDAIIISLTSWWRNVC